MTEPTPYEEALARLRGRGIDLSAVPGEFVVNWHKGGRASEYRTGDLAAAVAHALAMGEMPQQPAPLGPMGTPRGRRRGRIYAHNRKLAERRRSKERIGS